MKGTYKGWGGGKDGGEGRSLGRHLPAQSSRPHSGARRFGRRGVSVSGG
jgi:hypothetical protein